MKKIFLAILFTLLCANLALAAHIKLTVPENAPVGQPFFLEMSASEEIGDVTVRWRGKDFVLVPDGNTVRTILGFPNDSKLIGKTSTLTLRFDCGTKGHVRVVHKIKALAFEYPRQELSVAPAMVTPPKKEADRIARERKLVNKALATRSEGLPLTKTFVKPVGGVPTAYFGGFRVYNGVPRSGHGGLDLRAAVGTPVHVIADGTVLLTGTHYFAGGGVYVDHGSGVISTYFHLSKILVKEGQSVKAGDVIAQSGATGRVTGPHLHLGLYAGGAWLDALPLMGGAEFPECMEFHYDF